MDTYVWVSGGKKKLFFLESFTYVLNEWSQKSTPFELVYNTGYFQYYQNSSGSLGYH